MDTNRYRKTAAKRPELLRSADGRLRPASTDPEIGDIWAQQRRIGLAESLANDRRQAARERLRRERGIVGLALVELRIAIRRARILLFGVQSLKPPVTPPKTGSNGTAKTRLKTPHKPLPPAGGQQPSTAKNIEITLALPSLPRQSLSRLVKRLRRISLGEPLQAWRRLPRTTAIIVASVACLALAGGLFVIFHKPSSQTKDSSGQAAKAGATANKPAALEHGTPKYPTLLPAGKTIDQLGGWTRVSPPNRDAVYAYADTVNSTVITVSEQPLPANFKKDTDTQVSQLAQGYNASDKVKAGATTIYIGTSAKGPQSVIFARDNLLVLIKSNGPLSNDQWVAYVSSLK